MNIYINTQGARIMREGRHLLVKKGEDTYHTLFVEKLNQLMLFGNVALTPAARGLLLRHNVDTVFFRQDGRYLGRFATPESKNVLLRKKQFCLLDDHAFGVAFCRSVVRGKLTNMTGLLMRISRTKNRKEPRHRAKEIRALLPAVEQAGSIDSLRGYEGRGSALYFAGFQYGLLNPLNFTRRVRRPPTDPVNAVLSLLYTFLFNRVYAAVRKVNLDPYPAFLHVPDYGRFSLVMDLMEEFRVIVVDTLVLSLFNLKILQKNDFITVRKRAVNSEKADDSAADVTRDPYGLLADLANEDMFDVPPQRMGDNPAEAEMEAHHGKLPVKLTPDAFNRVIENFERKLTTEFHYLPEDRKITLNDALVAQAGMYRKLIEGAVREYQPLSLR
jgi:CRISPR-associated protein Cas1